MIRLRFTSDSGLEPQLFEVDSFDDIESVQQAISSNIDCGIWEIEEYGDWDIIHEDDIGLLLNMYDYDSF